MTHEEVVAMVSSIAALASVEPEQEGRASKMRDLDTEDGDGELPRSLALGS
jgi:hypothetical protein